MRCTWKSMPSMRTEWQHPRSCTWLGRNQVHRPVQLKAQAEPFKCHVEAGDQLEAHMLQQEQLCTVACRQGEVQLECHQTEVLPGSACAHQTI